MARQTRAQKTNKTRQPSKTKPLRKPSPIPMEDSECLKVLSERETQICLPEVEEEPECQLVEVEWWGRRQQTTLWEELLGESQVS